MSQQQLVQAFDAHKVRIIWDDQQEKYYFSIVDVVQVLTEQDDFQLARNYWKVLKNRLLKEGNETVTDCNQLKMPAPDGKMRLTDVADTEQVLRLVQSIPSKKGFAASAKVAQRGGKIVGDTRKQIEAQTGKSIVTSEKASDYIRPIEDESAELK